MKIPDSVTKTLSTFFYVGYLPFMPGTFASVAGIILFYFVRNNIPAHLSLTLIIIVLGFLVSGRAEKLFKKKDPKCIVIDEVSGMLLSLIFIPYDIKLIASAFILFRILDTLKPFPSGRVERLSGSIGIMGDDILAGVYTNVILQVVLSFASLKIS